MKPDFETVNFTATPLIQRSTFFLLCSSSQSPNKEPVSYLNEHSFSPVLSTEPRRLPTFFDLFRKIKPFCGTLKFNMFYLYRFSRSPLYQMQCGLCSGVQSMKDYAKQNLSTQNRSFLFVCFCRNRLTWLNLGKYLDRFTTRFNVIFSLMIQFNHLWLPLKSRVAKVYHLRDAQSVIHSKTNYLLSHWTKVTKCSIWF